MINSTNSEAFVFDNPFRFTDRYDAAEDFARRSAHRKTNRTETNVVPDALESELDEQSLRGRGATNMHWSMAGNTMIDLHASEIPAGRYKRAHRHSSEAFILTDRDGRRRGRAGPRAAAARSGVRVVRRRSALAGAGRGSCLAEASVA